MFPVVECSGVIFLTGRKLEGPCPASTPSIYQQYKHILNEQQESQFMVPVLSPTTALGLAAAQSVHNKFCGASPALSQARALRYFGFIPSPAVLFQELSSSCFKCRRVRMIKGKDLISPLCHLSDTTMVQGVSLQLDVAGPYLVYTKSKQYTGQLKGVRRTQTKLWILLCIDYFTSRRGSGIGGHDHFLLIFSNP